MASTTALLTGLTGLNANARTIEVVGNNIANVNTTAFKSSRLQFSTAMLRTIGIGSTPDDTTGGTNPFQIGLGVNVSGTQHDFTQGSLQSTGDARDLAIDGAGFFVVRRGEDQLYTRAGAFRQDAEGNLVTIDGDYVLGYIADEEGVIEEGTLTSLNIPLGSRSIAEATSLVRVTGNLNAEGDLPGGGSVVRLGPSATTGFSVIDGATNPPSDGNELDLDTLLIEVEDPDLEGTGTPLFESGQVLEISGARKGSALLPDASFAITGTTTIQELLAFFNEALGLHDVGGANPDGLTPGASLGAVVGSLSLVGNIGSVNDLEIDSSAIRLLDSTGGLVRLPFVSSKIQEATGESVRTTMIAYDSLGQEVEVDVAFAIEGKSNSGTTWRYFLESGDDSDLDLRLGTDQVSFDTSGLLISTDPITVSVDREATGAATPLVFALDLSEGNEALTALADDPSAIASTFRNGRPAGTLEDFGIGRDGLITGIFSNGLTRALGRVVISTFANTDGLIEMGSNLFRNGPNSGEAVVVAPTTFGSGELVSGALEQSNVDLGQEFIKMIMSSTGYSAASRVIRTADELLQQLLVIGR